MDEPQFWAMIDEAREAADMDQDEFLVQLEEQLTALDVEELVSFHRHLERARWKAYRWDMIAAMYIMKEGKCDDEDFGPFCGWLISQGKAVYDKALEQPDSLSTFEDVLPEDLYFPDLLELPNDLYEPIAGEPIEADPEFTPPTEPAGEEFETSELVTRFPLLCELYEFGFDLAGIAEEAETLETSSAPAAETPPTNP